MKKLNNKGYMLVEIILAFVIAFGILYFMMDLVIKLKNKNDDLLVETIVKTDSSIVTNKLMEYAIAEVEDNDTADEFCSNINIGDDKRTIKYGEKVINILGDTSMIALESNDDFCFVDTVDGKVSVKIPVVVKQNKDGNFDIAMDYNYELEETIIRSYWCANGSYGNEPWDLHYTGNCSVEGLNELNWRVKFLSTGTKILTVARDIEIDVFLVGGGGGGAGAWTENSSVGGGGGGGYTKTSKLKILTANTSYSLTVGTGGSGGKEDRNGSSGGASSAFGVTANGGQGGYNAGGTYRYGGAGGSGGGSGRDGDRGGTRGNGGTYGSNGGGDSRAGSGQGTTTCEFGEGTTKGCINGDAFAYARGGSGGGAGVGAANTGNGGGGNCGAGGAGGSGIIIIRNARDIDD